MRIARVIHGTSPLPVVALERDGALYDVGELELRFDPTTDPIPGATDFFTRVASLGGGGLAALDARVLAGERPTEARVPPGGFVWLPPCDADRSIYLHVDPARADRPGYRFGNARALLGHDARVPFPAGEERPDVELAIAAVLGDELARATADEADHAIFGYTILASWIARDEEAQSGTAGPARDFAAQLGPALITRDEIPDPSRLRAQLRVDGRVTRDGVIGAHAFSFAEAIAWASHVVPLRAGDVIAMSAAGLADAQDGAPPITYDATVDLLIERLGKLTGRPSRGPAPNAWKR